LDKVKRLEPQKKISSNEKNATDSKTQKLLCVKMKKLDEKEIETSKKQDYQ